MSVSLIEDASEKRPYLFKVRLYANIQPIFQPTDISERCPYLF